MEIQKILADFASTRKRNMALHIVVSFLLFHVVVAVSVLPLFTMA